MQFAEAAAQAGHVARLQGGGQAIEEFGQPFVFEVQYRERMSVRQILHLGCGIRSRCCAANMPVEERRVHVAELLHLVNRRAAFDELLLGGGNLFG